MSKSAHQAPRPRRHQWVQITLSAVAVLAIVSAVRYFTSINKDAATAPQASATPSAVGSSTPTPTPTVTVTPIIPSPGPSPLQPTAPAQVAAWNAGPGGAALASVSQQLGDALMAHGVGQFVEMKMACVKLAAAVTAAQANPPIPDATMQQGYQEALGIFTTATADCQGAISYKQNGDENVQATVNTTLNQATSALTTGAKDLYSATYAITHP